MTNGFDLNQDYQPTPTNTDCPQTIHLENPFATHTLAPEYCDHHTGH